MNENPCQNKIDNCHNCGEKLCLRENTVNLSMGNTDIMYCLKCLGKKEKVPAEQILAKIKKYILARECFYKEWIKYKNISQCPKTETCFPDTCFKK